MAALCMDLQIVLTYSEAACRYMATAYPTCEAAQEFGASIHEAVDLQSASVSSCLRTLLTRRRQAGDVVKLVTFSLATCEEMERWGLLNEWRASLASSGIAVSLQRESKEKCPHMIEIGAICAECGRLAAA
jgi:hypothetical protein